MTPSPDPTDAPRPEPSFDDLPQRDPYDLAARFLGVSAVPPVTAPPGGYAVGDVDTFYVVNSQLNQVFEVTAKLVYAGPILYVWVEQGRSYDQNALVSAAQRFEQRIYPTTRAYFGSEPSPGIDGDPHLHILNTTAMSAGVAGYFYSPSQYPVAIVPYSNEKEMFYINISNTPPGSSYYDAVLAHEFQHMIHWNVDRNETTWLNEGLSELSAFLNGFGPSGFTRYFMLNPDVQLTGWPKDSARPNYGASFLFVTYFLDRFGQDVLRLLVSSPRNGMDSVDDTLAQIETGITADDLFADWTIANILNDPDIPPGVYAYTSLPTLPPPQVIAEFETYPQSTDMMSIHQYGTDYIRLYGPARVRITFEGTQDVQVIPTNTRDTDGDPATDDAFVWWTNRGDDADVTLTHHFDLTGVSEAVLEYDLWYWLESLWDYGYVEISTDQGRTWAILATPITTAENPNGTAYGPGYTGASAENPDANADGWLHERLDLSDYAGREILLRFEVITDDAVNQSGLALDNVCINAIDFCDNIEGGNGDWDANGFMRHNNTLPQRFAVQLILPGEDGAIKVLPLPLTETNHGALDVTIDGLHPAILVVSGLTRYTTEPAYYQLTISPLN